MKRKSKKRQKNKKTKGINETKFWIFISLSLVFGVCIGFFLLPGTLTGTGFASEGITVKPVQVVCEDTDNGMNINERGVCKDSSGNKIDKCLMKGEDRVLIEYVCVNNMCKEQEIHCEDYCEPKSAAYKLCYLGDCHCDK